jgi:hypothetical protein
MALKNIRQKDVNGVNEVQDWTTTCASCKHGCEEEKEDTLILLFSFFKYAETP